MRFFDYLESSYAITNIETQTNYTAFGHAETQAISDLTSAQRKFFKFLAYFKVIFNYFLIAFAIKDDLKPAKLIIKEMQDRKAQEVELAKQEAYIKSKETVVMAALHAVQDDTVVS